MVRERTVGVGSSVTDAFRPRHPECESRSTGDSGTEESLDPEGSRTLSPLRRLSRVTSRPLPDVHGVFSTRVLSDTP